MNFGISTFVTDEGIAPAVLSGAIEERGFDSLFIAEHTHIPLIRKSPWPKGRELPRKYYRTLDPFVTLTAAAAATERLLVGVGVRATGFCPRTKATYRRGRRPGRRNGAPWRRPASRRVRRASRRRARARGSCARSA